jgi:hypothetical protein
VNPGTRKKAGITWLTVSAIVFALLGGATGCTDDSSDPPDRTSPTTTGSGDGAWTAGPTPVAAEPVPDCTAVVSLIPATVSTTVGLESGSAPQVSPSPDGYVTTCVLIGSSSADPRLRLFLQLRIERPRTDPYRMTPLDRWFDSTAKGFVGVNCSSVAPWATLDNGYRCETTNGPNVMLYLAGKAKGALVGLQTGVSPLPGQTGVTVDAARATATTSGEQILTAVIGSL